ncbi:hypothetical protein H0H93_001187 [Arthromyces matolae]|nr:hypothetical protein H0H93_001187 [Arthromyces matolae]
MPHNMMQMGMERVALAGRTAGVAKKARIISVKVAKRIDSYHPSDWVKAMMYVLRQHQEDTGRLSIALLSLEGPQHASIDHAAVLLAQEGIHVVVAAGNRAAGTPLRSSAHLAGVTVVGAVNMYDEREVPLQWVPEVADIHAPGKSILAASASPKTAAAHTAGVIACILSRDRGQKLWTPEKMKIELTRLALHNVVRGIPYGWPNFLLHFDPEGAVAREAPGTWGGAYGSREIMRIGA